MAAEPLYKRVMGSEFEKLPSVLKTFHASSSGARGSGVMEVRRGSGPLRRMLAALVGLPPRGKKVKVDVAVTVDGEKEIWSRTFNGSPLVSTQWEEDGYLAERMGQARFIFKLRAEGNGMTFEHCGTRIAGIPVSPELAMRVDARAVARDDGWDLEVKVSAPILGMITTYTGHIVPAP